MNYVNCNLCGSNDTKSLFGGLNIVRCKKCGLVYANVRPSGEELRQKYVKSRVVTDHNKAVWYDARINLFKINLLRIQKYFFKGRLLDIGCGYGVFLKLAHEYGFDIRGVDISESASKHAIEEFGLNVFEGTLEEARLEDNYFDVVTLWDVLDEIDDPLGELREIKRILKPKGLLVFRVRNVVFHFNIHYLLGNLAGKLRLQPTLIHIYGFSRSTARLMLEKAGFKNIRVSNSELTAGDAYSTGGVLGAKAVAVIKRVIFFLCQIIFYLSGGLLVWGPSLLVYAQKDNEKD